MNKKDKSYSISEIARGMAGIQSKVLMLEAIQDRGLLETSLATNSLSSFLLSEAEEEGPGQNVERPLLHESCRYTLVLGLSNGYVYCRKWWWSLPSRFVQSAPV